MLAIIIRISPVAGVLLGIFAGIAALAVVSELDCRFIPWGKRRATVAASLLIWLLTILPTILTIIALAVYGVASLF